MIRILHPASDDPRRPNHCPFHRRSPRLALEDEGRAVAAAGLRACPAVALPCPSPGRVRCWLAAMAAVALARPTDVALGDRAGPGVVGGAGRGAVAEGAGDVEHEAALLRAAPYPLTDLGRHFARTTCSAFCSSAISCPSFSALAQRWAVRTEMPAALARALVSSLAAFSHRPPECSGAPDRARTLRALQALVDLPGRTSLHSGARPAPSVRESCSVAPGPARRRPYVSSRGQNRLRSDATQYP